MKMDFKYIYGPVQSWRMGKSLGIDPLSDQHKICNLNCSYCQLGKSPLLTNERRVYVPTDVIIDEVRRFFDEAHETNPDLVKDIDYLTFSGRGEPTLASNLGEMIAGLKKICSEKIAVITNSTFLNLIDVRKDLSHCDLVMAKLDACDESSFCQIDKPLAGTSFEKVLGGIKHFRKFYKGKLAIQIMFLRENKDFAPQIADLIRDFCVDEIQINTPLRPSAAKPLSVDEIDAIKQCFKGMPIVTVYEKPFKETIALDTNATIKRHGNYLHSHSG